MKRILFVGDHCLSATGNGNMMAAILSQVDTSKFQIACFAAGTPGAMPNSLNPFPFVLYDWTQRLGNEVGNNFIKVLQGVDFDVVLMVGIDIWKYAAGFQQIDAIRAKKGFKWGAIFPYDLQQLRTDWAKLINFLDTPLVYSEHGLKVLKKRVPGIQYFRPPLYNADLFYPSDEDVRIKNRHGLFKTISDDDLIFGFVGQNQIRKDIPRLIRAFMEAKKQVPGIKLYLHTELNGKLNLKQMALDYGATTGDLTAKEENKRYSAMHMAKVYNSLDCLVNCTLQEGLSWTPLEAMCCGTPVIVSDTTAQTELVEGAGRLVPVSELAYVPVLTGSGESYVDAKACSVHAIRDAIIEVAKDSDLRKKMRNDGLRKAKEWLDGVSDINELLAEITKPEVVTVRDKIKKILFVQHSSAGDVLMTTQCFKGIKERHPGMELCYMTQPQYADIIEGNPYIDEIVPWDIEQAQQYEVLYNPHGERILPGNFNSGDVPLYAMYPYFCKVKADDMFIEQVQPEMELPEDYIVIQSSGGVGEIRTYKHMDLVLKGIDLPAVQIGGAPDMACHEVALDLRGKLSWREAAWVMAHAKAAIVMDSFPSHLAGALGTPVVVLYGPAPARVTTPRDSNNSRIINLEPNWLDVCPVVAACYGKVECPSPCINTISPLLVRKEVKKLLEGEIQL